MVGGILIVTVVTRGIPGDTSFAWGRSTDKPVIGDWNGDGRMKTGVFRNGIWILDYDGTGTWSPSDKIGYYGGAGSTPVVGKWNGAIVTPPTNTQFTNPGFETGNLNGWTSGGTTLISSSTSHSGSYSCHLDMTGTQETDYISQSIDLTNVGTITFWGYGEGNTWPFYIYIDGILYKTSNAVSNTWTLYTVPVSGYSGAHTFTVKWNGGPGQFGADVDDFSIS